MKNDPTITGRTMFIPLWIVGFGWRRMLFLTLILSLQATFAQAQSAYSFNFKNTPYESVFKQVGEQTGYNFFYSNSDLANTKPLTLSVSNVDFSTLLSRIFTNSGLEYEVKSNKTVVVKAAEQQTAAAVVEKKPDYQARTITGTVTDAGDKLPLPYTSITIKEVPNFHTATDEAGKFSISLPEGAKTLVFDFVGYDKLEMPISSQSVYPVALSSDAVALDESIVVGYQTRKKSTLTGSVKALDASVVQDKPVASFNQALQGQVAGVYTMSSGSPGGASTIMIRGVASSNYTVQPLYILDGTPISSTSFATLNANDIDQITILKDAAATSIYGSQAAQGVVLITSKRGKDMERPDISYRFQLGTSMLTEQKFTVMNTAQRLQYEEELGYRALDATGKFYINPDGSRTSKDSLLNINTNWKDEIFRNGLVQSHDLSIRGGSKNTRYYSSLNYYGQEGILPNSDFKRLTFRLNLDQNLTKYLKVGISSTLGREFKEEPVSTSNSIFNPVVASYALMPYYKPYNDDGVLVPQFQMTTQAGTRTITNPLWYYTLSEIKSSRVKSVTNAYAELTLFPVLTFKSSLGYDYQDRMGTNYLSPDVGGTGALSRQFALDQTLTNTNLFTFKKEIAPQHNLNVLLGQEYMTSNDQSFGITGSNLASGKMESLSLAQTFTPTADVYSKWTTLSFFTQASYNYANKYYLDLSVREDGNSRFGDENKWGTFWSVGASWNAKREKFLQDSKLITALNVFGSTGTSGNSSIGTYVAYGTYSYGGSNNYNGSTGTLPDSPGNQLLAWESVLKNNLGAEVTFLNKYRVKLEYFYNISDNMLFQENLSLTSGFRERQANMGKMNNNGVELEWDLTLLTAKDLLWRFNGNVSYTTSKIKDQSWESSYTTYKAGSRYGLFNLVRYAGVDPIDGKPLWYDLNNNITDVYSESNRVVLDKSFIPTYTGGFGSDFSYKRLSVSVFFTWVADRYMINEGARYYNSNGMSAQYNQSVDMLNHWRQPGDVTPYPLPVYNSNQVDTRYLENASFLRWKNLTISYTLDPEYLKRTKLIRSARIYVQAQNLLTFTGYTGYDPENVSPIEQNVYPQSRVFTFGLDLSF